MTPITLSGWSVETKLSERANAVSQRRKKESGWAAFDGVCWVRISTTLAVMPTSIGEKLLGQVSDVISGFEHGCRTVFQTLRSWFLEPYPWSWSSATAKTLYGLYRLAGLYGIYGLQHIHHGVTTFLWCCLVGQALVFRQCLVYVLDIFTIDHFWWGFGCSSFQKRWMPFWPCR